MPTVKQDKVYLNFYLSFLLKADDNIFFSDNYNSNNQIIISDAISFSSAFSVSHLYSASSHLTLSASSASFFTDILPQYQIQLISLCNSSLNYCSYITEQCSSFLSVFIIPLTLCLCTSASGLNCISCSSKCPDSLTDVNIDVRFHDASSALYSSLSEDDAVFSVSKKKYNIETSVNEDEIQQREHYINIAQKFAD